LPGFYYGLAIIDAGVISSPAENRPAVLWRIASLLLLGHGDIPPSQLIRPDLDLPYATSGLPCSSRSGARFNLSAIISRDGT